ncbi:MAG: hypothetical protein AAGG01_03265 [Planctomycetota bacterium]
MQVPSRAELRASLAAFDEVQTKVAGGVLAVMFGQPKQVQDREWMSEQFTQVALLTGQFEEAEHAHEGLDQAQAWIRANISPILNACFALFVHVAEDMRQQHGEGEFSASDAMIQALGYFDPV